jgi:SAM-dependent methyltransferase
MGQAGAVFDQDEATALFDRAHYQAINDARWQAATVILDGLPDMRTCLDVGAGPGWFTEKLAARGYNVIGVEGRPELAAAARTRVPGTHFAVVDIEDPMMAAALPPADLVFCFGLLYHLEDPFRGIRHLHALTRRCLLIETQILPGDELHLRLIAEGRNATQGLRHHALVPTRRALVKMLQVAGFNRIFRYAAPIDHEDFVDTPEKNHRREVFLATDEAFECPDFVREPASDAPKIDYRR